MTIAWSGYDNHLRVGIDHTISPANPTHADTSVTVTWKFYVGTDGWSFSDSETLHESATNWGGAADGFSNNLSGGSKLVGTHAETYGISANSPTVSASCHISGAYNGATPSKTLNVNLPNRPATTPSAPLRLQVFTGPTTTTAGLEWDSPTDNGGSGVIDFALQVNVSPSFDVGSVVNLTGVTTGSRSATGLTPNTRYYSRVRARNSVGYGPWSATTAFTTLAGTPSAPTGLVASSKTQTSIKVGWAASAENGGGTITYVVEAYSDSGLTALVASASMSATSHTFTGLDPSTPYWFRVKATNTAGTSAYSATLTTTTLASGTYTDAGDLVTLVRNLASAVGDKLVRLGVYTERANTAAINLPTSGTAVTLTQGTTVGSRGPDAPTYSAGVYTIQTAGTYTLECGYMFDESKTAGLFFLTIQVNASDRAISTSPKHGLTEPYSPNGGSTSVAHRVLRTSVHLDVGDTVSFKAMQTSGASMTQPTPSSSVYNYAKVTLTGF